jgi:hypothetical protein
MRVGLGGFAEVSSFGRGYLVSGQDSVCQRASEHREFCTQIRMEICLLSRVNIKIISLL